MRIAFLQKKKIQVGLYAGQSHSTSCLPKKVYQFDIVHNLHIHVSQYPRPVLYAVRTRLIRGELQILDPAEAVEIAAQIDDPALGLRRMRTNRPTHHLIVQSQRKRRPGQHHRVELRIVEARRQHADIRDDLDSSRLEVGEDALALLFRRILRHDSRHTRQAVGNVLSLLHEPGEQQYAPTIHPKKPPNDIQHSVVEAHAPILALHGVVRIVGPGRIPAQPVQIDQRDAVIETTKEYTTKYGFPVVSAAYGARILKDVAYPVPEAWLEGYSLKNNHEIKYIRQ